MSPRQAFVSTLSRPCPSVTGVLTIKGAAAATGLPEATLRAWERRYAVVAPARTPSGYRLYDERTVADLVEMHRLVTAGWAPSQAAAELTRRRAEAPETPRADPSDGWADRAVGELVAAAAHLDTSTLEHLLDDVFAREPLEDVTRCWLLPALVALGDAWEQGEVSIAGEHLASHALLRRLAAAYEQAGQALVGVDGPRVVVGLPAGARHELGALAFAVVARRSGARVLYLGPDLPPVEWTTAARRHRAEVAVIVVPTGRDATAAANVVAALRDPLAWSGPEEESESDPPGTDLMPQVRLGGAAATKVRHAAYNDVVVLGGDLVEEAQALARRRGLSERPASLPGGERSRP